MASVPFTQFSLLPRICRWDLNANFSPYMNIVQFQNSRTNKKLLAAVSRNKTTDSLDQEESDGEVGVVEKKTRKSSKRIPARTKKKGELETAAEIPIVNGNVIDKEETSSKIPDENLKKTRTKTRKKVPSDSSVEEVTEKVPRRRKTKKKPNEVDNQVSECELSDQEVDTFATTMEEESEQELDFDINDGDDISFTYGWPPLVCCFGTAQYAFVPWGKRANRLIDFEIHDRMKDALWEPEKFVRASGGCSSNVAVALANLGGKVAFMGKLGDDAFGQSLVYYLNINNVQTRSVRIDNKRATASSQMKIDKRGSLRMISSKPCAEDCLSKSEINIDCAASSYM